MQPRDLGSASWVTADDDAKSDAGPEIPLLASGIEGAEQRFWIAHRLRHCRRVCKHRENQRGANRRYAFHKILSPLCDTARDRRPRLDQ